MSLPDEITAAIGVAMRRQDRSRLVPLRLLKTALTNCAIEKGRALDDSEARQVVSALVKQRHDSIEQFVNGGRQDLADKEAAEIVVLEAYLPPSADQSVIDRAIADAVAETAASSPKDMGRVMKAVLSRLAGLTVDGKAVSDAVRKKLRGA